MWLGKEKDVRIRFQQQRPGDTENHISLVLFNNKGGSHSQTLGGSTVQNSSAGDVGSIPGSGRFLGEGNGNPLQYSSLENPMYTGAWWATVHGVAQRWTGLKRPGIGTHVSFFRILFHYRLLQDTDYSCLCSTVGPCLSLLYGEVCSRTCWT